MAKIFSQKLMTTKPLNNFTTGYNNNIMTNLSMVIGVNNSVNSPFSSIIGKSNTIIGDNNSNTIVGDSNLLTGNNNIINGISNLIISNNTLLTGNNNKIQSDSNIIFGNNNITISEELINNSLIIGNNNYTNSSAKLIGDNNNIIGASNSYIFGNNNTLLNGIIVNNYSITGTWSDNIITTSDNIYISGNYNVVGTSSQNIAIYGSNNQIAASVSNIFLVGNNISQTASNQYIIGSDKTVNIQGKVLPCDLIQNHTPVSATDPYGPNGSIVKDNENIYVRTDLYGWREIPFNNSYGHFFDTTNQTNPTASIARAMLIGSVSAAKNVYIANNSQITVAYSGIYNIQFSAQIEKSGGGNDDIDIWLRYNGVDIPWTNTRITVLGNNGKAVAAWNFIQTMTASSNCELMWSSADTGMSIYSIGTQSNPDRPGIPSLIVSVDKISSI